MITIPIAATIGVVAVLLAVYTTRIRGDTLYTHIILMILATILFTFLGLALFNGEIGFESTVLSSEISSGFSWNVTNTTTNETDLYTNQTVLYQNNVIIQPVQEPVLGAISSLAATICGIFTLFFFYEAVDQKLHPEKRPEFDRYDVDEGPD